MHGTPISMPPGHIQALMKPMAATLSMPREWVELMAQAATISRFEQGQMLQVEGDSAEADGSAYFNGMSAANLNGTGATLGLSFDPEGFVVAPNGNFFVADEYGPSLYEFKPVQVGGAT